MSRHLHLDPFSGVAGDMFLGLLLDLGLAPEVLASVPDRLGLDGVVVRCGHERRGSLAAGRVHVVVRGAEEPAATPVFRPAPGARGGVKPGAVIAHAHPHDHGHEHEHPHGEGRALADALKTIDAADLPDRAKAIAKGAFERLYAAEGAVHGVPADRVRLHEAGADDALVDIAGTALGLVTLGIDAVSCSVPIPVGGGAIHCAHGILPVPGPAVAHLLEGLPVVGGPIDRELVTPTGAALLRAVVGAYGPVPTLVLERTGHGAGTRDDARLANVLRGVLGRPEAGPRERLVSVLETALDDIVPQDVPPLVDALLADGARDALVVPVQMKKGRPGFLLLVVCDPADEARLARRLLEDSPTLGVRVRREARLEWDRDVVTVDTPWGPVRIKRALDGAGRVVRGRPEFEDCRRAAEASGRSIDEVRGAAQARFEAGTKSPS